MNELAVIEDFEAVTNGCTKTQKLLLVYLLVGIPYNEAEKMVNRSSKTLQDWRYDKHFDEVKAKVMGNSKMYAPQAFQIFMRYAPVKATVLLMSLAERITDWDTLKAGDKKHVMEAAKLVHRMPYNTEEEAGRDYDELRLRRYREG